MRNILLAILTVLALASPTLAQSSSYSNSTLHFGDQSGWRTFPTTGPATGVYRQGKVPWVQAGPITCNECRVFGGSSFTFNNAVTVVPGVGFKNVSQPAQSATTFRGDGGSHVGAGGQPSGQTEVSAYSTVAATAPEWPLYGEGGWNDNGNVTLGGNGGGGFYLETTGKVLLTSTAAFTADGVDGVAQATPSGAGAGGGIDIRTLSTLVVQASATLSAKGGKGGNGTTYAGRGGGGGLVNLEALGGVTYAGTTTVTGGATGTGPAGGAGGVGLFNNGVQFSGPRLGGW